MKAAKPQAERMTACKNRRPPKARPVDGENIPPEIDRHFLVEGELARGHNGVVWLARPREKPSSMVVIKGALGQGRSNRRLQEEIALHSRLQHANLARFRGSISSDQGRRHFLVLDYEPCGTLQQFMDHRQYEPLPEPAAATLLGDIVEALSYLRQKNIVHSDLHGGNVLLSQDGTTKLADFGCATTELQIKCGMERVRPIEQRSQRWITPESDLWGLGLLMLLLLTGQDSSVDVEDLSQLSDGARQLVTGMLQLDPEERLTLKQVAAHPWIESGGLDQQPQLGLSQSSDSMSSSTGSNLEDQGYVF